MDDKNFYAHLREHGLMSDAHRIEHVQLAEELKETARELSIAMRETAERLAENLRTTADIHLRNHEREHAQADRAADKAEESMGRRLESMNEFREQLTNQAATFMTRESAEAQHAALEEKLAGIQKWVDVAVGRSAGSAPIWALGMSVLTAISVALAVAAVTR